MDLRDKLGKMTGLLGKPEKPMGRANLEALQREITFLEGEFNKMQSWANLAIADKGGDFKKIMEGKIADVMNQYHGVSAENLTLLQTKHTLLKEMLYAYENATVVKDSLITELKKKRQLYEKASNP
jgi:hypothetical protein